MSQPTSSADTPYIISQREQGIVTLTLNRGDRFNPLSEEMLAALQGEIDTIAKDSSIRLVVLAARGKAFCAGHDLKQMRRFFNIRLTTS